MRHQTPGEVAFDLYAQAKRGKTYDNKPIPAWGEVGRDVKDAWEVAARGVIEWWAVEGSLPRKPLTLDDLK
jgi:hypothetical protein